MPNSSDQSDRDLATATLNASISNFGANMLILSHIIEQIRLQRLMLDEVHLQTQMMKENERFHRELLKTLDIIIKNQ